MALEELEARYATKRAKDHKLAGGEGLYLLVRASGSKLWRFKYRFAGKEKLLAFGVCLRSALPLHACGVPRRRSRWGRTGMVRSVEARGALDVGRRLKQHVSQIYRFAIPQGWAERDPAEHLGELLKARPPLWTSTGRRCPV